MNFPITIITAYQKYISAVNQMTQKVRLRFRTVISDGIIQTIRTIRMCTFRFLMETWQRIMCQRQLTV